MDEPARLPLKLLETFASIADHDGDASAAATALGISQPTISKRLAALRRLTGDPNWQPWLVLKGKQWQLTDEGRRVRGVVSDLIHQYRHAERFVFVRQDERPGVSIACGSRGASSGFVRVAVERFLRARPDCRLRLATPRTRDRIEGIAGGKYDLAVVSEDPAAINRIAGMELYARVLFRQRLVVVGAPRPDADWAPRWNALPRRRPLSATDLLGLPLVLPEPDAVRRQQFEAWYFNETGFLPEVVLETGGSAVIRDFARAGLGIGLVSEPALAQTTEVDADGLTHRRLDDRDFGSPPVTLIARKAFGQSAPDLPPLAGELAAFLSG